MFAPVVIGQNNYFAFDFTILNWKVLYVIIPITYLFG